ncbi:MAG: methyltransferase [Clostridia bacterium]|nr:methyltransferase [Clostridia bacterium]
MNQTKESSAGQMYFAREPLSASKRVACEYQAEGQRIRFQTDAGVFSVGEVDAGSDLLIRAVLEDQGELRGDVLDLGCGWGAVGISLGKCRKDCRITMVDVNLRALELAKENAIANGIQAEILESDGFSGMQERLFDAVITNPPIRTGKEKVYELLDASFEHLRVGGRLYVVIRKQQGGDSCIRHLKEKFSDVEKIERSGGYWVIRAVRDA